MTELTHSTNEDKANKLHPFNKRFELNSPQLETDILSLITPLGLGVEESTISSKIKVLLGSGESIDFFYFPLNNWKYPIYLRIENSFLWVSY